MAAHPRTIPIEPAEAAAATSGCGSCLHGAGDGPLCPALPAGPALPPRLDGPAPELQRLLAALVPALGLADSVGTGVVRSLQWQPGEVELQLAVSRHCGGALLADAAFQTLRDLLPDTDVYVTTSD